MKLARFLLLRPDDTPVCAYKSIMVHSGAVITMFGGAVLMFAAEGDLTMNGRIKAGGQGSNGGMMEDNLNGVGSGISWW